MKVGGLDLEVETSACNHREAYKNAALDAVGLGWV